MNLDLEVRLERRPLKMIQINYERKQQMRRAKANNGNETNY